MWSLFKTQLNLTQLPVELSWVRSGAVVEWRKLDHSLSGVAASLLVSVLTVDSLSTFCGVFVVQCVELMLKIEFGVLLFDCVVSRHLSQTFYQVWALRSQRERRKHSQTCGCYLNRQKLDGFVKRAQSWTSVHFAKSNPTQSTSWLTQPNPIHDDHVYSDPHPIQSIVPRSGENTVSCNTKNVFVIDLIIMCS